LAGPASTTTAIAVIAIENLISASLGIEPRSITDLNLPSRIPGFRIRKEPAQQRRHSRLECRWADRRAKKRRRLLPGVCRDDSKSLDLVKEGVGRAVANRFLLDDGLWGVDGPSDTPSTLGDAHDFVDHGDIVRGYSDVHDLSICEDDVLHAE